MNQSFLVILEEAKKEAIIQVRESVWAARRRETAFFAPSEADRREAADKYQREKNILLGDTIFVSVNAHSTC